MTYFHSLTDTDNNEDAYESLPKGASLTAQAAAGAFAGIMEHSIMFPVDLIKTRLQIVNPTPAALYGGMTQALTRITTHEGILSLWKGLSSVIVGAGPAHAIYFGTYEAVKSRLGGLDDDLHHPFITAVSGATATIASDAFMNPFDVIKQRMQVHGSKYLSAIDCAKSLLKTEGLGTFYVSYPTTLAMNVPYTALQFSFYESIAKILNPSGKYDPSSHVVSGGVAGALASFLTTPLDVVKTLLQTRGTSTDLAVRKCQGFIDAFKLIHLRYGLMGFWRGWKPRILTAMPSTAICWLSYEAGKELLMN